MPPRGWSKIEQRETEFRMAYQNLRNTGAMLAQRFGVSEGTIYNYARRLGLPRRLGMLEALGLPPFGKRRAA